jgi:UDP-perosamine 4-acetyltransferase
MKRKIKTLIIGAGAHSKIILDVLQKKTQIEVVGFVDDNKALSQQKICGLPVLGPISSLERLKKEKIEGAIVGIGNTNMKIRRDVFDKAKRLGFRLVNAIHPKTIIARNVKIGEGVLIAAGAIINTDAVIGNNVVIYTGTIMDHDNVIEDNVYLSPGVNLSGKVTIKEDSFLGTGVIVIPEITIGRNVTLGAGAVVVENIPDDVVAIGLPAKVIRWKRK